MKKDFKCLTCKFYKPTKKKDSLGSCTYYDDGSGAKENIRRLNVEIWNCDMYEGKKIFKCINHINSNHLDCDMVEKQFDVCKVCNDSVWVDPIVVTTEDANPHLPAIFKEAAGILEARHDQRYCGTTLYTFGVRILEQEFVYYDFGQRNHWEFKFAAVKK